MFDALLNDETVSCSDLDWALTNKTHPTNPSSPTSSPLAPPDLIQTKTTPSHKTDLKVRRVVFTCVGFYGFMFFVHLFKQNNKCLLFCLSIDKALLCFQTLNMTSPTSINSSSCSPKPEEEQHWLRVTAPSLLLRTLSFHTPQGTYPHILI